MSVMPKDGHIGIAELIKTQPLHVAWGPGDGVWVAPVPPTSINDTELIEELGRRTASSVIYVAPVVDGDPVDEEDPAFIKVPGKGFYKASAEPTKYLLITAQFNFGEEPTATIRQTAVFMGTQTIDGLPPGLRYFTPDQIQSKGRMLQLQNLPEPIPRDSEYRTRFVHLIEF